MKKATKRTRPKPPPRPDDDDRPSVPVRYRLIKARADGASGTFLTAKREAAKTLKMAAKKAVRKKAKKTMTKGKKGTKARSAITGRYVKKSYAKKHPRTTVVERVKRGRKKVKR